MNWYLDGVKASVSDLLQDVDRYVDSNARSKDRNCVNAVPIQHSRRTRNRDYGNAAKDDV